MKPSADWYFDVVSPFAYLQSASLPGLAETLDITPRPVLLAGLLKHWGQRGPAEIAPKRLFTYRHCVWLAEQRGIPFRMPPAHPFNPLGALRLLTAMDADLAAVRAALAFVFAEGQAVDDEAGVSRLAVQLGATPEQLALARSPIIKDGLRHATEAAIAAGVFGVPSFVVDGEVFWGSDCEAMLQGFLTTPERFRAGELGRVAALPAAASRLG